MGRISQQKRVIFSLIQIPDFLEPIVSEDVGCLVDGSNLPEDFELLPINVNFVTDSGGTN
jgi:hypothetical protein